MTAASAGMIRTLAFGDLETGIWGVAAVADRGAGASFAESFELDEADGDEWLLAAGGLELRFSPTSDPAPFAPDAAGVAGFAQLCTVQGAIHRDGSERDVACLGARSSIALPPLRTGSVRAAIGWFGPENGFAVLALRPAGAAGHDRDAIACALVDNGHPLEIDEARLSSTYTPTGLPLRAGLELWPPEPEPGDETENPGGDDEEQSEEHPVYPRRVGGEQAGDASRVTVAALDLRVELFRWHSKGLEGPGVYVLAPAP
jgi:hypothetical protein